MHGRTLKAAVIFDVRYTHGSRSLHLPLRSSIARLLFSDNDSVGGSLAPICNLENVNLVQKKRSSIENGSLYT